MAEILLDTMLSAANLMLVTLSLSLVYALVKFPNFAQVEYATLGAFTCLGFNQAGIAFWIAAPLACLVTGLCSLILHRLVFAKLLRSGAAIAMIGSLAVAMILRASLQVMVGARSRSLAFPLERPVEFMGLAITSMQITILLIVGLVVIGFFLLLLHTKIGMQMRAIAAQPLLATASGINVAQVVDIICLLAGAAAALGGILLAAGSQVDVNLGQSMLLPVFAAAIIGGLGSPLGAIAGSLLLALAETLIVDTNMGILLGRPFAFVPLAYGPAAGFALLVVTLLVRPNGLFFSGGRRV